MPQSLRAITRLFCHDAVMVIRVEKQLLRIENLPYPGGDFYSASLFSEASMALKGHAQAADGVAAFGVCTSWRTRVIDLCFKFIGFGSITQTFFSE